MIPPSLALGTIYIALIARITRATMLEVLAQDYVRTAHAKDLARRRADGTCAEERRGADRHRHRHRHCAADLRRGGHRERICDSGIGRLTVDAIIRRDYPIIQGVILLFSAVYVFVNLAVDLSYRLFDPRIRY